tara:strand:- start:157 stop:801 length:645 start_codon:yes stop_codon:yes gene_type:complete
MNKLKKGLMLLSSLFAVSSCSLVGIQNEEGPKYTVLTKEGDFEIRQYSSYVIAETTIEGDFDNASGSAFRILAGYIFGKNKGENKIAMTSPVEMEERTIKIAMTSPVEMQESGNRFTMRFSMPSEYQIEDLPEPLDPRIVFQVIEPEIRASNRYSWLSSKERSFKKSQELRAWLKQQGDYTAAKDYVYAGYNPPWTLPFLRRNEVHIVLKSDNE